MNCRYFVVDAFTSAVFGGNQAGVCLLEGETDSATMQKIAAENNLAETAFILKKDGYYNLRWFSPELEIDLCGHATLASAHIILSFVDSGMDTVRFETQSGTLTVKRLEEMENTYEMDFPSRMPTQLQVTAEMEAAAGVPVLEAHASRDLLLLLKNEEQVKQLKPDMQRLCQLKPTDRQGDYLGVIATAKGDSADFVSRFFAPNAGIPEDPATGSSHTTLIPFWAARLGKSSMLAKQLSKRGGTIYCKDAGDRVKIAGEAALYLTGAIQF